MRDQTYYNNISFLLDRYVPSFVKDEYPLFYEFLETYYEWCQQNDKFVPWNIVKNIQNWNDVDTTIDEFIDAFKSEYINLPVEDDWELYIKHHKEIYDSKGSTKSLKFFIKLLTGLDIDIEYPNRNLMKSSDGIWRTYKIIFCERNNSINYSDYISTVITGLITGTAGVVEKIELYNNYVKIFLSSTTGVFVNEPIRFNNGVVFESNIINVLSGISVINGGNNYKLDDEIQITNYPSIKGKVNYIYSGKLDLIDILDGGVGYKIGDRLVFECDNVNEYYSLPYVEVSDVDENGTIKQVKVVYAGYGMLSIPKFKEVITENGLYANFSTHSYDAGKIGSIIITYPDTNIIEEPIINIISDSGVGATVAPIITYDYNEAPYYYKAGSFLSDVFKLQDSYYYQEYSYVLNVAGSVLERYKDLFKTILHPAGFIFFTNTILSNYIELHKEYINSTLDVNNDDTIRMYLDNYIELLHFYDRLIDGEILYPYRKTKLETIQNNTLDSFRRVGGSFVNSSLDIQ